MTLIERAARALHSHDSDYQWDWIKYDDQYKEKRRSQARVVIESLREPTEEMIASTGRKAIAYVVDTLPDEAPRLYWMSMIDAILKEDDEGIRP